MSESDPKQQPKRPAGREKSVAATTRLDAAHQLANRQQPVPAATEPEPANVLAGESLAERLRTQANQLAMHLRSSQRELDHRVVLPMPITMKKLRVTLARLIAAGSRPDPARGR